MTTPFTSFGYDPSQPGASEYPRVAIPDTPPFYEGLVEDIIINNKNGTVLRYNSSGNNVGEAKIRLLPEDIGLPVESLRSAFPLEAPIQEYPLLGEIVIVYKTAGKLYYTRRINTTGRTTNSTWPRLRRVLQPRNVNKETDNRELIKQGVNIQGVNATNQIIEENSILTSIIPKPVRAEQGDLIFHGRFNNVIRMGSNLFKDPTIKNPEANILLTAGLWDNPKETSTAVTTDFSLRYENLDNDKSSIWMVANQVVPFKPATVLSKSTRKAHVLSSPDKTSTYDGAQIFINSDRVIINSKKNEISLFSSNEINLSSIQSITLDTENKIFLRSFKDINIQSSEIISLDAKSIIFNAKSDLSYKTFGNYSITGKQIFIGRYGDTTQPMVLGGKLSQWLQTLVTLLLTPGAILTVTGPATINPAILPTLLELKNQLGTPLTPNTAIFNSKANFTSEINPV
jgi:hypothetical protein